MWASMNLLTMLRGNGLLLLSPPLNARERLQIRSLNLSKGRPRGQRNVVQARAGRNTSASDATCAERWALYRSAWCKTVATGNVSRRAVTIHAFVVPRCQAKASNVSGGQESEETGAGDGTAEQRLQLQLGTGQRRREGGVGAGPAWPAG